MLDQSNRIQSDSIEALVSWVVGEMNYYDRCCFEHDGDTQYNRQTKFVWATNPASRVMPKQLQMSSSEEVGNSDVLV